MWAPKGTTTVQGINALLNILYSFIGHPLIPSYIGDMRDPQQFPTALYITMGIEIVLFTILGAVVYIKVGESSVWTATLLVLRCRSSRLCKFTGTDLTVSPAYGSLTERLGKAAAGLALPTIVSVGICSQTPDSCRPFHSQLIVGSLFSLVTSRAAFFQIYKEGSMHRRRHTWKGWAIWVSIVTTGWVIAFIVAEAGRVA